MANTQKKALKFLKQNVLNVILLKKMDLTNKVQIYMVFLLEKLDKQKDIHIQMQI